MKLVSAARNFYTPTHEHPISGGAEVWLGYYQSLRPGQVRKACVQWSCGDSLCLWVEC
jgi:Argonaute linker 1 domain